MPELEKTCRLKCESGPCPEAPDCWLLLLLLLLPLLPLQLLQLLLLHRYLLQLLHCGGCCCCCCL